MELDGLESVYLPESIPYGVDVIDKDELKAKREIIRNQYVQLNDLGINYLKDIEDQKIRRNILQELVLFVNEHYTPIADLESIFSKDSEEMASYIYQFFCVDCRNIVCPNVLNQIKCYSREDFEMYLKSRLEFNPSDFKKIMMISIKSILDQMLKLQEIDKTVSQDHTYKKLIKRFSYYLDFIDFGDAEKLMFSYLVPVMNKYFEDILWRSQ